MKDARLASPFGDHHRQVGEQLIGAIPGAAVCHLVHLLASAGVMYDFIVTVHYFASIETFWILPRSRTGRFRTARLSRVARTPPRLKDAVAAAVAPLLRRHARAKHSRHGKFGPIAVRHVRRRRIDDVDALLARLIRHLEHFLEKVLVRARLHTPMCPAVELDTGFGWV